MYDLRLASLVAVIRLAGLSWRHWGVVDKLQEVFSEASNDSELLAVLLQSIELVSESCLELLTGDVGKLSLCNEGLCLGADKLLFKNNDTGAVRLLVFELSDLIGDLLLACRIVFISSKFQLGIRGGLTVSAGLDRGLNVANALDGYTVLVVAVDKLVLKLADLVDQNTKLVRNIRNIVVTALAPD